jgi:hypothetical protein
MYYAESSTLMLVYTCVVYDCNHTRLYIYLHVFTYCHVTYTAAATQANATIDAQLDDFGKLPFVTFFLIVVLLVFPVGIALVFLNRNSDFFK